MDSKTQITAMSETMVEYVLASQGWYVFRQTTGKAPFDLIAYCDGRMERVSVRSTQAGLQIDLRRIRSNKTGTKIHHFDATSCDVVACYLHEHGAVTFIASHEIKDQDVVTFALKPATSLRKDRKQRFVHEYQHMPITTSGRQVW